MKNKKLIYLLLFVVVAVWGMIIRRVVSFTSDGAPEAVSGLGMPGKKANVDEKVLILDYRDPFLQRFAEPSPVIETSVMKKAEEPQDVIAAPPFGYKGMIQKGKETYAVIFSGGSSEILQKGETLEDYELKVISADSVVMQKGRQRFTIRLQ